jgi:hypothetical protein
MKLAYMHEAGREPSPMSPEDIRSMNLRRCMRAVARGEMTVDEAWAKYQSGEQFPIDDFGRMTGEPT